MSDLKRIKRRILEEDKLFAIYEAMGCEFISPRGGRIEAMLPEKYQSSNKRAVQTKYNDNLSSAIRNRGDFEGGDIYSLISYIHNDIRGGREEFSKDIPNAKRFICETLGWTEFLDNSYQSREDFVAPLRELAGKRRRTASTEPNPVISEKVLNNFITCPYSGWIEEGISYKTQDFYGIGFDLESKRITIPMRNRFGQLVGVKGRILKDEDDDRKYMYLYKYQNQLELFNFHLAHPYILDEKKVFIFESEKSPMKMFDYGIYNSVAIGASDLTPDQVRMIQSIGTEIDVILCYDKGITKQEIRKNAEKFGIGNKVYAMYDTEDILEGKNSPIDQGIDTFEYLLKNSTFEVKMKKMIIEE